MKRITSLLVLMLFLFLVPIQTIDAHPGRTDANGGHTCRTNCEKWGLQYGQYHYHNGGFVRPLLLQRLQLRKHSKKLLLLSRRRSSSLWIVRMCSLPLLPIHPLLLHYGTALRSRIPGCIQILHRLTKGLFQRACL